MELITGTTTEGMNGYPQNLKEFVYGFETFKEAEQYATEHKKNVCLFKIRDGHNFYKNLGETIEPLTIYDYLSDLGDDYSSFDFEYEKTALSEKLEEIDDVDEVRTLIQNFSELLEKQEDLNDGEMIILHLNQYYETCNEVLMSYSEDVYSYVIGVQ